MAPNCTITERPQVLTSQSPAISERDVEVFGCETRFGTSLKKIRLLILGQFVEGLRSHVIISNASPRQKWRGC
jgi:hypothetical protein